MATVQVTHTWPNGEETTALVRCATSYPDAVAEAKATAVAAFREAVAYVVALDEHADDRPE